jgi:hypothetical protein
MSRIKGRTPAPRGESAPSCSQERREQALMCGIQMLNYNKREARIGRKLLQESGTGFQAAR